MKEEKPHISMSEFNVFLVKTIYMHIWSNLIKLHSFYFYNKYIFMDWAANERMHKNDIMNAYIMFES